MVDKVGLRFQKPTKILNQSLEAGYTDVPLGSFVMPKVEYGNPDSTQTVELIELHVRVRARPGDASNAAINLVEGVGANKDTQHVHIVAPIPFDGMKSEPTIYPMRIANFHARNNLMLEMMTILAGDGVAPKVIKGIEYRSILNSHQLEDIVRAFQAVNRHGEFPSWFRGKGFGLVRMRGPKTYDGPDLLWGQEVTRVGLGGYELGYSELLNGIQGTMYDPYFGLEKNQISHWLKAQRLPEAAESLNGSYYNQDWTTYRRDLEKPETPPKENEAPRNFFSRLFSRNRVRELKPEPVAVTVDPNKSQKLRLVKGALDSSHSFHAVGAEHQELKMLVFDWSRDPLFFNQPEKLERIQKAQATALAEITETRASEQINAIMKKFILNSGIYENVLHSLGVEILE